MGDSILAFEPPPTKVTRVRPQLSCIPCRQGKLKCNRQHPACDQCVKRSRESQCNYVPPPPKDRTRKAKDMRGRIRHLESLVVDLMNGKDPRTLALNPGDPAAAARRLPSPDQQPSPENHLDGPKTHSSSGDDDFSFPSAFGALKISDEETTYMGGSHWMAVLNDIKEVKSFLDLEEEEEEESEKHESEADTEVPRKYSLVVGSPRLLSKRDLVTSLPPRHEADRLVNLYLRCGDPTSIMFHVPTFQSEYQRFWANPSGSPVMFIAMLYGMLSLAAVFALRAPSPDGTPTSPAVAFKQAEKFRNLCASAAVLADFGRPKPYSVEALMLYAASEYLASDGSSPTDVWHIFGTVVRSALRMGYHRDPSHYGNISPFHGEMRRRTWHLINGLDVLLSFSLGLPCIARGFQSDTRLPRNLREDDLSPDLTDLPPERPDSELTLVLYTIVKGKVLSVFAPAADAAHAVTPPTYAEIMDLDNRLEDIHTSMPPAYRMKPLEESNGEPPDVIMNRLNLELLYQKTRCVLHRTYLVKAHTDPRFEQSRKACLEASMVLLNLQKIIYRACQPGGPLTRCSWYYSSLTSHDFLLAAMLVCLEVNLLRETKLKEPERYQDGPFASEEMFGALEDATRIWDSYEDSLIDASDTKRAAKAFRHILGKLKTTPAELEQQRDDQDPIPQHFNTIHHHFNQPPVVPSNGPEMGYAPPTHSSAPMVTHSGVGYTNAMAPHETLGEMLEMPPLDINWETWDKQVLPYDDYMHEAQQWSMAPPPQPNMASASYPPGYHPGMTFNYHQQ